MGIHLIQGFLNFIQQRPLNYFFRSRGLCADFVQFQGEEKNKLKKGHRPTPV